MKAPMKLIGIFAGTLAAAQDGTCVSGVDPMGQEQTCLGRCHVFVENSYGACGNLITSSDITRNCGDTPQNACISTFNAAWDGTKGNCGNCYLVEMDYDDGTTNSVYLKTIDTNASETKFEMMQYAWEKLCPYVCLGYGNCAPTASACPLGIIESNAGYPASCNVQYNQVRFKRVACDGSDNNGGSSGGNGGSAGGSGGSSSGNGGRRTSTTSTTTPRRTRSTTTPRKTSTTSRPPNARPSTTRPSLENAVATCQRSFKTSSRDSIAKDCQTKCEFFYDHPYFCGGTESKLSGRQLTDCVAELTGYCEQ